MKTLKKTLALLMALAMCMSLLSMAAFAALGDYQIKVENTNDEMSINGKTYYAYKVFDLTLGGAADSYTQATEYDSSATYYTRSGEDPNYTYTAATVADAEAFAAGTFYTKGDPTYSAYAYSIKNTSWAWATLTNGATTAAPSGVITTTYGIVLTPSAADPTTYSVDGTGMTADNARAFADALKPVLPAVANADGSGVGANEVATIDLPEGGWYAVYGVVIPTDPKADSAEEVVAAVGLTTTDKKVTVHPKASVPPLDKKITGVTEDGEVLDADGRAAVAKVGAKVSYELDSKTPDLTGYSNYTFTITDTISAGLTYDDTNLSSLVVKIDGTAVAASNYTLTVTGRTFTLTIPFNTLKTYEAGKDIVVTYDAIVNDSALTTDYENNTAKLTYSNNPYDTTTNETPEKKTYVIDLNIDVVKIGNNEQNNKLDGAQFKLYKTVTTGATEDSYVQANAWAADTDYYIADGNGGYMSAGDITAQDFQNNGSIYYTLVPGSAGTTSQVYYKWADNKVTWVDTQAAGDTFTTNSSGKLTQQVRGLDQGTYYLEETKAPEGYNVLSAPVQVTITAVEANGTVTYSATTDGVSAAVSNATVDLTTAQTSSQPVATATINNNSGTELPETGGIGTKIFYTMGTVLVIGAGVILVSRKRAGE